MTIFPCFLQCWCAFIVPSSLPSQILPYLYSILAPTPPPASSRSLTVSPYKRTITYSKRDRARVTAPSRHPQTRTLPTPQTSSASKRNASSSRNALRDVIDLSNNDSDIRCLITAPSCQTRSRSRGISSSSRNMSIMELSDDSDVDIADIRKRLADALKELDATKKEVEQYEAATKEENTCEMCVGVIWQPCILPCGHVLCAECIYDYVYYHRKAGHQLHSTTCGYCRAPILRAPVLSLEWQERVADMALAKGIPIPERTKFTWPPPPGTPKHLRSD
ncbi:hypothetical protein BT96DRAFT_1005924 [Gymnopus androsaceus JB14]|uniref:RING-type domain-containing protein n=1 Tax=Gymnopus androsaceus JB14 TaxID=1447944 RepID=A0A6A4GMV3_9AGAR|nr:hypothetical protein BT96DRAFT_1005924 [Gymnopus androsaceus JB14]